MMQWGNMANLGASAAAMAQNQQSAYASGLMPQEPVETPLQRDLRCIREALDRLDAVLMGFAGSLHAVLTPLVPTPDGTVGQTLSTARSPYGDNLREYEQRIHFMADRMQEMQSRLEV